MTDKIKKILMNSKTRTQRHQHTAHVNYIYAYYVDRDVLYVGRGRDSGLDAWKRMRQISAHTAIPQQYHDAITPRVLLSGLSDEAVVGAERMAITLLQPRFNTLTATHQIQGVFARGHHYTHSTLRRLPDNAVLRDACWAISIRGLTLSQWNTMLTVLNIACTVTPNALDCVVGRDRWRIVVDADGDGNEVTHWYCHQPRAALDVAGLTLGRHWNTLTASDLRDRVLGLWRKTFGERMSLFRHKVAGNPYKPDSLRHQEYEAWRRGDGDQPLERVATRNRARVIRAHRRRGIAIDCDYEMFCEARTLALKPIRFSRQLTDVKASEPHEHAEKPTT